MKFPKNNIVDDWIEDFERRHPWQAFKVKIEFFFINLRHKLSIKSRCCNVPLENKECRDAFGDMPIYNCSKCNKKWI